MKNSQKNSANIIQNIYRLFVHFNIKYSQLIGKVGYTWLLIMG